MTKTSKTKDKSSSAGGGAGAGGGATGGPKVGGSLLANAADMKILKAKSNAKTLQQQKQQQGRNALGGSAGSAAKGTAIAAASEAIEATRAEAATPASTQPPAAAPTEANLSSLESARSQAQTSDLFEPARQTVTAATAKSETETETAEESATSAISNDPSAINNNNNNNSNPTGDDASESVDNKIKVINYAHQSPAEAEEQQQQQHHHIYEQQQFLSQQIISQQEQQQIQQQQQPSLPPQGNQDQQPHQPSWLAYDLTSGSAAAAAAAAGALAASHPLFSHFPYPASHPPTQLYEHYQSITGASTDPIMRNNIALYSVYGGGGGVGVPSHEPLSQHVVTAAAVAAAAAAHHSTSNIDEVIQDTLKDECFDDAHSTSYHMLTSVADLQTLKDNSPVSAIYALTQEQLLHQQQQQQLHHQQQHQQQQLYHQHHHHNTSTSSAGGDSPSSALQSFTQLTTAAQRDSLSPAEHGYFGATQLSPSLQTSSVYAGPLLTQTANGMPYGMQSPNHTQAHLQQQHHHQQHQQHQHHQQQQHQQHQQQSHHHNSSSNSPGLLQSASTPVNGHNSSMLEDGYGSPRSSHSGGGGSGGGTLPAFQRFASASSGYGSGVANGSVSGAERSYYASVPHLRGQNEHWNYDQISYASGTPGQQLGVPVGAGVIRNGRAITAANNAAAAAADGSAGRVDAGYLSASASLSALAAESGGDFYKNYQFNVAGGGRSKASNSAASSQASLSGSCPASGQGVTSTTATAAAAAATAASTLTDEHVSRANSRRMRPEASRTVLLQLPHHLHVLVAPQSQWRASLQCLWSLLQASQRPPTVDDEKGYHSETQA
ncbi:box A-binding factor isoform X4 [Drosophila bipectinata]|uniref:box A-binding factor isoform X4 n=1 Tax=Drosophila bipectinata TaxID=42026 RepID=UPI0038B36384